ncbi:hypothetical protein PACILC2_40190 [Paenibacillus cisolokensis]|uniref:Major facilitator superfamily (MFS) profile domain-containing protein n=2 Tax=Paenibacillus TaxID=44249 RepID=A0ABQ4NB43_9BACL|nr:hypothetical protein PACILC2_40190 [Paenibacillus cisolokensis]
MQAGTMTGGILGPLFGGLLAEAFGLRRSFVAAAVILLAGTAAVIVWVKEGRANATEAKRAEEEQSEPFTFRMALRSRALVGMLLLLVLFQLSVNMFQPLMTLHIADLQGGLQGAVLSSGFVLSLIGIAGILASPVWGRLGESKGYYRMLTVCLLMSGFIIGMQYFVQNLWLFAIVQFIFGLFMAGIAPIINTLVVQNTDERFRGRSFGLTTSANQLGSMLGPLIGGMLGLVVSIHWIFAATGIIMAGAGASVWLSRRLRFRVKRRNVPYSM